MTLQSQEKVGQIRAKIPTTGLSTANTTKDELARVRKEQEIAKRSLLYPFVQQAPNLFSLLTKNSTPGLGQKISSLSGLDTNRVQQASKPAFPSIATEESIYDIAAAQPTYNPNQLRHALEHTQEEKEEIAANVEKMAQTLDQPKEKLVEMLRASTPFPNLALEILNLGLKMETFQTEKLSGYKKEGDEYKARIKELLHLASLLPKATSESSSYPFEETKQEILDSHEKLKAMGIDLFPGIALDKEISKDQLIATNSLINHHIDMGRTSLQELFSTKISIAIHFMSMMGEVMKKVCEKDNHLKEKTNQLPR